ncbi:MAG: GTPase HflX [Clostridiales bacterium]|nr:GTPase HflX [Clostridiales bacterium]MDY6117326.1 GTPase HflX [Anaerovoracaceae bacterium]
MLENSFNKSFNAILVAVNRNSDNYEVENSMNELESLVESANGVVVGKMIQNLDKINTSTYIGKGKVAELAEFVENLEVDTVIFDDELSGVQIRNLEDQIGTKVIDRTILIMDIFAARANSKEGRLQVELAQLQYRLPRLVGFGKSLSRLGGGIGTRGPGEKQIETDRRHIRRRIDDLKKDLADIQKTRTLHRKKRKKSGIPIVALVGYTNVGKSAIMNYMIENFGKEDKKVEEADMLFATLDAKHRLIELDNRQFILVDTVGFVSKLSHNLVDAFKGTLQEAEYSDLIVKVEDISHERTDFQREILNNVLDDLKLSEKKSVFVYNKIDKIDTELKDTGIFEQNNNDKVFVSAKTGLNMGKLTDAIVQKIFEDEKELKLVLPFDKGDLASKLCDNANVLEIIYKDDGIHMIARLSKREQDLVKDYVAL